jgi:hypothetical protein
MNKSTYALLALITAAIGLASSAVTMDFFILGLQRMESDTIARDALIAAGVLMIVTELAAFGLAALLPVTQLRALRGVLILCGLMLLAFEGTTIYVTQATLARNADTHATGSETRIAQLRASIALQRAAAASLQVNGQAQSESSNSWTRQMGAKAVNEAVAITQGLAPLTAELAELEASKRATMTDVLGAEGVVWYSVARAMLISIMGLVMFGAAGALLRAGRGVVPESREIEPAKAQRLNPVPSGFKPSRPSIGWAIPAAAIAAISSPAIAVQAVNLVAAPAADTLEVAAKIEAPRLKIEAKIGQEIDANQGRYQRVRVAVQAVEIKPSVMAIKTLERVGGEVAMALLARLEADGVTVRQGRVWVLA